MHLTSRGLLLLFLAAPVLAAGTWAPALPWVAGFYVLVCVSLLALDWRLAESVHRFEVSRRHDSKLSLGADNPVHLSVRNRSRHPARFWIRDEPPAAFVLSQNVVAGALNAHQVWQGTYTVHPVRRGDFRFEDVSLRWVGPLGLVIRQGRIAAAAHVKVYPNLLEVRRYDLLLRRSRLQELGLRRVRLLGEGTEFERLREYLPDDDYRRINWKATARRHQPITVEYQTERSQSVMILLDIGRLMQSPVGRMAKLDYGVNAALLLAYVATGKGDKIGLMTFADEVTHFVGPRQGRGQFYRLLEVLYAIEAQPVEPDYPRALSTLAVKQRKRALVVVFTDLSGGLSMQSLIKHAALLARRHLPLVVTISDPDVHAAARQTPRDSAGVYQRAAASQVLDERRLALDTLRRHGVLTLDVPANRLSIAVIDRYLELKARTRL